MPHALRFTLAITVLVAIATWSARETSRVRMADLGNPNAVPVPVTEAE